MPDISEFETKLGIKFKNQNLLKEALTHRSYLNENPSWPVPNNERMEFLGDAVLELVVTNFLYKTYPDYQEGQLTSLRAALVNYQMMARVAREMLLDQYIFLSRGEAKDTGKAREVILANAIEAFIGAIYLDQGYDAVAEIIERFLLVHIAEIVEKGLYRDPKSLLQEITQEQLKITPTYNVLEEKGPDHQKNFLVGVFYGDKKVGEAWGTSKQEAETHAAEEVLKSVERRA